MSEQTILLPGSQHLRPRPASFRDFDTRDDHKELLRLLGIMPPMERLSWLRWCCSISKLDAEGEIRPRVTWDVYELAKKAETEDWAAWKLQYDCYRHLWDLHLQWHLDLGVAIAELVSRARKMRIAPIK